MLLKYFLTLTLRSLYSIKKIFSLIGFLALYLSINSQASAVTFNISEPTVDGTFTLSWSGAHSFVQLDLKIDNGATERVGEYVANGGPITFTKPWFGQHHLLPQ